MTRIKYDDDGVLLTDCCSAHSTYHDGTLVCKSCFRPVPPGQGDGTKTRGGPPPSPRTRRELIRLIALLKLKAAAFEREPDPLSSSRKFSTFGR
jgi:hypothetical protein